MAENVLKVRELDTDGIPGREISLTDIDFTPLDYETLRDAKLHQHLKIPLRGRGRMHASVGLDIDEGENAVFSTILESRFTSKAIGLVKGGWLPSALASIGNAVVLPDRCVVAQLNSRLKNGATKSGSDPDFIDLFADGPVRINPLLFVLEGDGGENPTTDIVGKNLAEAVAKLRSALPHCEIVAADDEGLKGVLGLIDDTRAGMQHKQGFLLEVNQKLKSPVSRKLRGAIWDQVLCAAKNHALPTTSLVVLAALSSIVTPQGRNPAKGLLKFGEKYSSKEAYNGLADIRALELLMGLYCLFPDQRLMLCTADKDMALFWVGIGASNFRIQGSHFAFDIKPTHLLPNVSDIQWSGFIARS
ncbi:hypothetical protein ACDY97_04435 [Rhizobium mongolense]|uniref:hypothetical protein n=1 Tax=Rhizobium mongolense TaxID=57676 RepID=UPI003558E21A